MLRHRRRLVLVTLPALVVLAPARAWSQFRADDPAYYTQPWTSERTFTLANGDLKEYSCGDDNRSPGEGRITTWVPPAAPHSVID